MCLKKFIHNRNIWIYGAGVGGRILKNILENHHIKPSGFVDRKWRELRETEDMPVVWIILISWSGKII
jgi:hypothetical protein